MAKQAKIIDCQCPCSPRSIGFRVAGKNYTVYAGNIRQMVPTARKGEVKARYLPRPSVAARAVALQLVVKDIHGLDVDFNRLSARDFLDKAIDHVRGLDKEAAKGGVYMANAMTFFIPNVKGIYPQIWSSDDGVCRLMTDISDSYCTDRMDAVRAICLWMSFQLQKNKKHQPEKQDQRLCGKLGLTENKDATDEEVH